MKNITAPLVLATLATLLGCMDGARSTSGREGALQGNNQQSAVVWAINERGISIAAKTFTIAGVNVGRADNVCVLGWNAHSKRFVIQKGTTLFEADEGLVPGREVRALSKAGEGVRILEPGMAAVAPNGDSIAIIEGSLLHIADLTGREETKTLDIARIAEQIGLAAAPEWHANDWGVAWTPDGTRVAVAVPSDKRREDNTSRTAFADIILFSLQDTSARLVGTGSPVGFLSETMLLVIEAPRQDATFWRTAKLISLSTGTAVSTVSDVLSAGLTGKGIILLRKANGSETQWRSLQLEIWNESLTQCISLVPIDQLDARYVRGPIVLAR